MQVWAPKLRRVIQGWACALFCLPWLACVAPMRVPTHTQGPAGQHVTADLSFLHVGSTTRAEVEQQMGWADAKVQNDRLFLGRWRDSKWVVAWVVAGGGPDAGGGGFGGTPRVWHTHNLIVEFDEKGVVAKYHVFSDGSLIQGLTASLRRVKAAPLDVSNPAALSVRHRRGQHYEPATLLLGKDAMEVTKPDSPSSNFKIALTEITAVTFVNGLKEQSPDPESTNYTLHFSEKTKVGRSMTIRVDIPTLVVLVQHLAENGNLETESGVQSVP